MLTPLATSSQPPPRISACPRYSMRIKVRIHSFLSLLGANRNLSADKFSSSAVDLEEKEQTCPAPKIQPRLYQLLRGDGDGHIQHTQWKVCQPRSSLGLSILILSSHDWFLIFFLIADNFIMLDLAYRGC